MNGRINKQTTMRMPGYGRKVKRIRRRLTRRLLVTVSACILFFSVMMGMMGFISSAQGTPEEDPVSYKYYKTIVIEKGDTLWDIAEEYCTEDYASLEDYIAALKEMNHLDGDTIYAGERLMIAYEDTRFIK